MVTHWFERHICHFYKNVILFALLSGAEPYRHIWAEQKLFVWKKKQTIMKRKLPEFKDGALSLITNIISYAHGTPFISDPKALLHQLKHGKFMSECANQRQRNGFQTQWLLFVSRCALNHLVSCRNNTCLCSLFQYLLHGFNLNVTDWQMCFSYGVFNSADTYLYL